MQADDIEVLASGSIMLMALMIRSDLTHCSIGAEEWAEVQRAGLLEVGPASEAGDNRWHFKIVPRDKVPDDGMQVLRLPEDI